MFASRVCSIRAPWDESAAARRVQRRANAALLQVRALPSVDCPQLSLIAESRSRRAGQGFRRERAFARLPLLTSRNCHEFAAYPAAVLFQQGFDHHPKIYAYSWLTPVVVVSVPGPAPPMEEQRGEEEAASPAASSRSSSAPTVRFGHDSHQSTGQSGFFRALSSQQSFMVSLRH